MIIYFKSILDVWQIVVWKFYVYDRSHDLYYLTIFKTSDLLYNYLLSLLAPVSLSSGAARDLCDLLRYGCLPCSVVFDIEIIQHLLGTLCG